MEPAQWLEPAQASCAFAALSMRVKLGDHGDQYTLACLHLIARRQLMKRRSRDSTDPRVQLAIRLSCEGVGDLAHRLPLQPPGMSVPRRFSFPDPPGAAPRPPAPGARAMPRPRAPGGAPPCRAH